MKCFQCSNQGILNTVLGKDFYYCRICKIEIVEPATTTTISVDHPSNLIVSLGLVQGLTRVLHPSLKIKESLLNIVDSLNVFGVKIELLVLSPKSYTNLLLEFNNMIIQYVSVQHDISGETYGGIQLPLSNAKVVILPEKGVSDYAVLVGIGK